MRTAALALAALSALAIRAAAAPSPSARTANGPPSLVALLLNPEANAARRRAVVEVKLTGAVLEDPEQPRGAHLLVRLDQETPLATAQTRISFHDLAPGEHSISFTLVDADDKPLGAEDAVWLKVSPAGQP